MTYVGYIKYMYLFIDSYCLLVHDLNVSWHPEDPSYRWKYLMADNDHNI